MKRDRRNFGGLIKPELPTSLSEDFSPPDPFKSVIPCQFEVVLENDKSALSVDLHGDGTLHYGLWHNNGQGGKIYTQYDHIEVSGGKIILTGPDGKIEVPSPPGRDILKEIRDKADELSRRCAPPVAGISPPRKPGPSASPSFKA